MKKHLHPKWFNKTPVYCNGCLVKIVSSTKSVFNLDIWSGNHSFFTKSFKNLVLGSQVEHFFKKYTILN